MRKCAQCGAELLPEAKFCPVCGAPAPKTILCPGCGRELPAEAKFCPDCGQRMQAEPRTVRPEPRPQASQPVPAVTLPPEEGFSQLTQGQSPAAATAQSGAAKTAAPHIGPMRSVICPSCGAAVPPGRTACPRCNTQIIQNVNHRTPYAEQEAPIRETKAHTGLWIALAGAAVLVIAVVAAVLIFWDDLFGSKDESNPTDTVNYGTVEPVETKDRPGLNRDTTEARMDRPTTEPTQPPVTAPAPTQSPVTEPRPSEVRPTQPPVTAPPATAAPGFTWDEVRTLITLRYPGDLKLAGEDASNYYVEVRDHNTGALRYQLQVNKQTGAITVTQEYPGTSDSSEPAADPTEPTPTESQRPAADAERVSIDAVDPEQVDDYMEEALDHTDYSFTVVDLNSGAYSGSDNRSEPMSSSVLIGIPVMYTVNKLAQSGVLSLDDMVSIQNLGGGGRGVLVGDRLSVRELLRQMLRSSSGAAINNLAWYVGMDTVNRVCREAGYSSVSYANYIASPSIQDYTDSDNYVSTQDICGMLYELYNGSGPVDRSFLEDNFGINVGADPNSGLGRSVDGALGSFNGLKEDKYNDVILVQRNGKAYAVAMMAHGDAYKDIMSAMDTVGAYLDRVLTQ